MFHVKQRNCVSSRHDHPAVAHDLGSAATSLSPPTPAAIASTAAGMIDGSTTTAGKATHRVRPTVAGRHFNEPGAASPKTGATVAGDCNRRLVDMIGR